jgi:hypothetical protein
VSDTIENNGLVPVTVRGEHRSPVSRREAMQWVMGAVAAGALPTGIYGQQKEAAKEEGRNILSQEPAAKIPDPNTSKGYGTDPKLVKSYKPGEVWPLTLNDRQKKCATALADTIIPGDDLGPAASEAGVVAMIDEWVSAPYPQQQGDRPMILQGLEWTDQEAAKRFQKDFADLTDAQRHAICDDVCYGPKAAPQFRGPARFFARFRDLCASAYYATPAGWKAIGYVGNVALEKFDGPPPEVLSKLGLT